MKRGTFILLDIVRCASLVCSTAAAQAAAATTTNGDYTKETQERNEQFLPVFP